MQSPKYLPVIKSEYVDKLDWFWLSTHPKLIPILKENQDKVDWNAITLNPNKEPKCD